LLSLLIGGRMDGKYGRLFTQEDVERLFGSAVESASQMGVGEGDLTRVREALSAARDGMASSRFPADEPLFLLRGKDLLAPVAVQAYGRQLFELGDVGMAQAVEEVLDGMRGWQRSNRGRVGLPD
jgi:hypothetical protein